MATPEEIIKLDNFKTESKLKEVEILKGINIKNTLFTSLILGSENYQETLN